MHSRLVGYDVFVNVPKPDIKDPQRIYDVRPLDFGLRKRSAVVDAGIVLPNVTDGFTGRAPDLGALELGGAPPRYGPSAETAARQLTITVGVLAAAVLVLLMIILAGRS